MFYTFSHWLSNCSIQKPPALLGIFDVSISSIHSASWLFSPLQQLFISSLCIWANAACLSLKHHASFSSPALPSSSHYNYSANILHQGHIPTLAHRLFFCFFWNIKTKNEVAGICGEHLMYVGVSEGQSDVLESIFAFVVGITHIPK